jgi:hypothetical protein
MMRCKTALPGHPTVTSLGNPVAQIVHIKAARVLYCYKLWRHMSGELLQNQNNHVWTPPDQA